MENSSEIRDSLQKAMDILCKAKMFEEKAMVRAQELGLQGEKRRLRYESAKNHQLINYIKCDSFDVYGFKLETIQQSITVPEVNSIRQFFEMYLSKIEEQYDALHALANKLVALNAQHAACKIYDKCRSLIDDIKYYRRTILEGSAATWKPEFIFLHQTTAENVHDEFEGKEKKVGYDE